MLLCVKKWLARQKEMRGEPVMNAWINWSHLDVHARMDESAKRFLLHFSSPVIGYVSEGFQFV
jgi:hypothetical protein